MDDRGPAFAQRAGMLRRYRTPASDLRDAWRESARRGGWMPPEQWWTPAVDALARAVGQRRDQRTAAANLGRARAGAGFGARQTLQDLFALYRGTPAGVPRSRVVRAVIEAWAEVALAPSGVVVCGDPRNGTTTAQHLRALLGGVYQLSGEDGPPLSDEFVVLIVDVPGEAAVTGWEPATLLLELGHRLPPILPAQALLVVLSPSRLGTLVRRTPELPAIVAELTAAMPRGGRYADGVILTAEIPESLESAHVLLNQVAAP